MREPVTITCRPDELRRVRVTCRCGGQFVIEVPEPIAGSLHVKECPGCGRLFGTTREQGQWKTRAMADRGHGAFTDRP
jgi:hypothetical protein